MKTSSPNAAPEPPSVQTARGFVATNLALPGFGSLLARRSVGWPQALLTVLGFALTLIEGGRSIIWFFQNFDRVYAPDADPTDLLPLWLVLRWALLGMALFALSWLWSLATNSAILRSARLEPPPDKPPVLR